MMNSLESDSWARFRIPSVERILSAICMLAVKHPHSGCIRNSALGCCFFKSKMGSGLMRTWVWQEPFHRWIFLSVLLRTQEPRYMSGRNRISCSGGKDSTIAKALLEVQMTSEWALTAAVVLI